MGNPTIPKMRPMQRLEGTKKAFAITPDDATDLSFATRGIIVAVSGNVSVIMQNDTDPVTVYLAAGVQHALNVKRVRSTGTTATGIVGLY